MSFKIHMGVPEMEEKWNDLKKKFKEGNQTKDEVALYKKWEPALTMKFMPSRHKYVLTVCWIMQ